MNKECALPYIKNCVNSRKFNIGLAYSALVVLNANAAYLREHAQITFDEKLSHKLVLRLVDASSRHGSHDKKSFAFIQAKDFFIRIGLASC